MSAKITYQSVTLPNTSDPFQFMNMVNKQIENYGVNFKFLNRHYDEELKEKYKAQVFAEFPWLVYHVFQLYGLQLSRIIKNGQMAINDIPALLQQEIFSLAMFGSWRVAPNIFEIDPNVLPMLEKSSLPLNAPMSIFNRIPFWGLYVKLPTYQLQVNVRPDGGCIDMDCYGYWVYKMAMGDEVKLCLFPHYANFELTTNAQRLFPSLILPMRENVTIQQAVDSYLSLTDFEQTKDVYTANILKDNLLRNTSQMLSSLLLLCVEEPQITPKSSTNEAFDIEKINVLPSIHKKTGMFVPPSVPKHFMVAQRLGGQIRDFITQEQKVAGSGTVAPHIRQAHWHSYRCGPNRQDFKLNFLAPIFVNFSDES